LSFKDIKGQDKAVSFLKSVLENNRFSQAYIFFGPNGVGKKLTALNFAKAFNCAIPVGQRPCDACVSCRKIDASNHPDVFLLVPEKEDASIKIDQVREVIKNISLKAYEARKKVYIIDDAHLMTPEAQNALLKTLEEPPSDSVLILITDNMESLFSTIVSRSQVVKFFPFAVAEVKDILTQVYKIDAVKAHILAHISSGMLGEALRQNDEDFFKKRSRIIKGLEDRTFFDWEFEGLSRPDLKLYLDVMLTWYRDILIAKTGLTEEAAFVNIDKRDAVLNEAARADFAFLDSIIKQIISTNSFLEQNANPKLAMSVLGLQITGN